MMRSRVWLLSGLAGLVLVASSVLALEPKAQHFVRYATKRIIWKVNDTFDPRQSVAAIRPRLLDPDTAMVLGPAAQPDEAGSIVIFVDYNCIYCRRQFEVLGQMTEVGTGPRVFLRHLPHSLPSVALAQAMLAARRQGGEMALHRVLAGMDKQIGADDLPALAEAAGLDPDRLRADAADPAIAALLDADIKMAWNLRINSTPTLVAGDTIKRGVQDAEKLEDLATAR